jgi:hypothetical protein
MLVVLTGPLSRQRLVQANALTWRRVLKLLAPRSKVRDGIKGWNVKGAVKTLSGLDPLPPIPEHTDASNLAPQTNGGAILFRLSLS